MEDPNHARARQARGAALHSRDAHHRHDVLSSMAAGMTPAAILADFPYLTAEDLQACLAFAADRERTALTAVA